MTVSGTPDRTDAKPIGVECPFRVMRSPAKEGDVEGACRTVVCGAGGGAIIDDAGAGPGKNPCCEACDIPLALAHPKACLYLVPFRVFKGDEARSFYACRWRLDFKPLYFPENIDWCRACSHWFPRPPEDLVANQADFSRQALALYLSDPTPYLHPALKDLYTKIPEEKKNWVQRLWRKTQRLIRG